MYSHFRPVFIDVSNLSDLSDLSNYSVYRMSNFTREDYKTAIRDRYKIAIREDATGILSNPKPAELRDFYFRIFEKGLSKTDKEIMDVFFGVKENIPLRMAIEGFSTGKLKSIILFFEGGNTNNKSRIEMMAILVDFQPRPYSKFQEKKDVIEENNSIQSDQKLEQVIVEVENGNSIDLEKFNNPIELDCGEKKQEIEEGSKIPEEKDKLRLPKNDTKLDPQNQDSSGNNNEQYTKPSIPPQKNNFISGLLTAIKSETVIATGFVICLVVFGIIYFNFFNKQCMQWSGDHYEKVDCDLKTNGFGTFSGIEPYDEIKFELRKVNVCDTTNCFINGKSIIWYAKTDSGADFFNTHGMHPENGKALRPVTEYIRGKYKKKDCASK